RIKHRDSESIPAQVEDVARVAISEDGESIFANESFRARAGDIRSGANFKFDWLTTPDNRRYLIGSEAPAEPQAENDFAALADLSSDIMIVIDDQGNIRSANAAFVKIFGFAKNETDFIGLFHDEDKPYIRNTIRSMSFDEAGAMPVM